MKNEQDFAKTLTELNLSHTLALALPAFYQKTGISSKVSFEYDGKSSEGIILNFAFAPKEPSPKEYQILLNCLRDYERITMGEHIIQLAQTFPNIHQFTFKIQEEVNQSVRNQS